MAPKTSTRPPPERSTCSRIPRSRWRVCADFAPLRIAARLSAIRSRLGACTRFQEVGEPRQLLSVLMRQRRRGTGDMRHLRRHLIRRAMRIFAREPRHRSLIELRQLSELNRIDLTRTGLDVGQGTARDAKLLGHIVLFQSHILASFLEALAEHLTIRLG